MLAADQAFFLAGTWFMTAVQEIPSALGSGAFETGSNSINGLGVGRTRGSFGSGFFLRSIVCGMSVFNWRCILKIARTEFCPRPPAAGSGREGKKSGRL